MKHAKQARVDYSTELGPGNNLKSHGNHFMSGEIYRNRLITVKN